MRQKTFSKMLATAVEKLKDYANRVRTSFAPDYERDMGIGSYYLQNCRPDLAIQYFARASRGASSNEQLAQALEHYAHASVVASNKKLIDLDYPGDVKDAYRKAIELSANPEIIFNAALTALDLREAKDAVEYLGKAVEHKPDDSLLIKIGRLATSMQLDELVEKVKRELDTRCLSVHLYPI